MSEGQCTICGDGQFVQWECPQCGRQVNEGDYAAGLAAGEKGREELMDGLRDARRLIEGLGLSPLELAAKYGPDYMPPDEEEIGEMYEAICTLLSRQVPAISIMPCDAVPPSEISFVSKADDPGAEPEIVGKIVNIGQAPAIEEEKEK